MHIVYTSLKGIKLRDFVSGTYFGFRFGDYKNTDYGFCIGCGDFAGPISGDSYISLDHNCGFGVEGNVYGGAIDNIDNIFYLEV